MILWEKKIFFRFRISRKETKETEYWLELILEANPDQERDIKQELDEAMQIKKILSVIIYKLKNK
ncbi:MAG: four helix bundle protein [Patescibacteria group bacterium]